MREISQTLLQCHTRVIHIHASTWSIYRSRGQDSAFQSSDMQPLDWTITYLVDSGKFKLTQICESWGFDRDLKLQSGHAEEASL
jgi:hypothetical protein